MNIFQWLADIFHLEENKECKHDFKVKDATVRMWVYVLVMK